MTAETGKTYCSAMGGTLAAIYDTTELASARDVIAAAGIEKAITAAECTWLGWTWFGTQTWESSEFPLNTGQVTDYDDCTDSYHVYSLHASGDSFIWVRLAYKSLQFQFFLHFHFSLYRLHIPIQDADTNDEEHPVLCRSMGASASSLCETLGFEPIFDRGCHSYIHMDDYATYGVTGGSTTLAECAAAVQRFDGVFGCRAEHFFFEDSGYCNCPTDTCPLGYENYEAGGSGQLYQACDATSCAGMFNLFPINVSQTARR